ncbi:MAG: hypothetical protein AMJ92_04635 [candidate division Zixibacteria bacterium SM23_81]|nr:MAG: hypothetical protein AMJ92_04635 [candidate division Zixibacteria bacterium SM23_81]
MFFTVSRHTCSVCTAALTGIVLLFSSTWAADDMVSPDSGMILRGGEQGTVFKSLTVEGEDQIRIEFSRPSLDLELDPKLAPGLEWESTHELLDHYGLDLVSPLLKKSAYERCPYLPRPWLNQFASGDIVHFRPAVEGVDRWELTVANSQGHSVAIFKGKGKPPKEIGWDGRSLDGALVPPGLTYSYVLEAFDRAGNKRNFVGEGFELPSYRRETPDGFALLLSGRELSRSASLSHNDSEALPAPILLEAASWINLFSRPDHLIRVEVTARTYDQANALSQKVVDTLKPLLLGDPIRIQDYTNVQPDAPDQGTVSITVSRS